MKLHSITEHLDIETFYDVKIYLIAERLAREGLYHSNVVCKQMFGFSDRIESVVDSINKFSAKYRVNNFRDFTSKCIPDMSIQEIRGCVLAICDVDLRLCEQILSILESHRILDVCSRLVFANYMSSVKGDNSYMRNILLDKYSGVELMIILRHFENKTSFSRILDVYFDSVCNIFQELSEDSVLDNIHLIFWLVLVCSKYDGSVDKVDKFYKNLNKLVTTNCNSVIEGVLVKYGMNCDTIVALNYLFQTVDSGVRNAFENGKKDKLLSYVFNRLLISDKFHCVVEEIAKINVQLDIDTNVLHNVKDCKWVYNLLKNNSDFDKVLASLDYSYLRDVIDLDIMYRLAKNVELKYDLEVSTILHILDNVVVNRHNCDYLFDKLSIDSILEHDSGDVFFYNLSTYLGDVDSTRKEELLDRLYSRHGRRVVGMLPNLFSTLGSKLQPYYKCRVSNIGFDLDSKSYRTIDLMFDFVLEKYTIRFLDFLYYVITKTNKFFEYSDVLEVVRCLIECDEFTTSELEYLVHSRVEEEDKGEFLAQIQGCELSLEDRIVSGDSDVVDEFKQLLLDDNIELERAYEIVALLIKYGLADEYDLEDINDLIGDGCDED